MVPSKSIQVYGKQDSFSATSPISEFPSVQNFWTQFLRNTSLTVSHVTSFLSPRLILHFSQLLPGAQLVHERPSRNSIVNLHPAFPSLLASRTEQTAGKSQCRLPDFHSIDPRMLAVPSVSVAMDAMQSASNPHAFMGVTEQGLAAIVKTRGNQDVHVILRGGTKGPNYSAEHVQDYAKTLSKKRDFPSIMVDCSRRSLFSRALSLP